MKLILITSPKSNKNRYELNKLGLTLLSVFLLLSPIALGMLSYQASQYFNNPVLNRSIAQTLKNQLTRDKEVLAQLKEKSDLKLTALTISLADAHSRLIRLEALGQKLVKNGGLKNDEFDFSRPVAIGGLEDQEGVVAFSKSEFSEEIDQLILRLDAQEVQMEVIESLMDNDLLEKEIFLAGSPVNNGWVSSSYGKRLDPFTGKLVQHTGVDFPGQENDEIIAVASGVVTESANHHAYGMLVEIDHGQNLKTRYAHNKENKVKVGDIVHKGQTIALMGSTGRSTGTHSHFEVLHHNEAVNPERYIYRED